MPGTSLRPEPLDALTPEVVRAAFRELHGSRLHGFALLITLGDRSLAARLSADALDAAARHTTELRHPERAAAWLRTRVVRSVPRRHAVPSPAQRRAGLDALAVEEAVVAGLAALPPVERAALVASSVERLDRRDVETIVGRDGSGLDRVLAHARRAYLAAFAAVGPEPSVRPGTITERVRGMAARTMR